MKKAMVGNLEQNNIFKTDTRESKSCQIRGRLLPEVMALNKYILDKDIWVTAVIQVPSNVSLEKVVVLKMKEAIVLIY